MIAAINIPTVSTDNRRDHNQDRRSNPRTYEIMVRLGKNDEPQREADNAESSEPKKLIFAVDGNNPLVFAMPESLIGFDIFYRALQIVER